MEEATRNRKDRQKAGDAEPTNAVVALATRIARIAKEVDLSTGDAIERIGPLHQIATVLNDLREAIPGFHAYIGEVERDANASMLRLEADLVDRCSKHGWHVEGHWPSFWINRGVLLEIDERNCSATISGSKVAASAATIVRTLEPLIEGLIPPRFSPAEFATGLAEAYDAIRSASSHVPILELYRAFVIRSQKPRFWRNAVGKDFVGLSLDQFRARLSTCLEQGRVLTSDGRELRLSPPINPKDGLFVYQPGERRFAFVGHMEFVGV